LKKIEMTKKPKSEPYTITRVYRRNRDTIYFYETFGRGGESCILAYGRGQAEVELTRRKALAEKRMANYVPKPDKRTFDTAYEITKVVMRPWDIAKDKAWFYFRNYRDTENCVLAQGVDELARYQCARKQIAALKRKADRLREKRKQPSAD
jgi:hypothetical protein